jgi:hypothetical protein
MSLTMGSNINLMLKTVYKFNSRICGVLGKVGGPLCSLRGTEFLPRNIVHNILISSSG